VKAAREVSFEENREKKKQYVSRYGLGGVGAHGEQSIRNCFSEGGRRVRSGTGRRGKGSFFPSGFSLRSKVMHVGAATKARWDQEITT